MGTLRLFIKSHGSGASFGQLAVASAFGTAVGEAAVPAAPGWGTDMALSRFVLTSTVTIAWPATWAEIVNQAPALPVATPAIPASTVAQANGTGVPVVVAITGGTVTAVTISGTTAATSSPVTVIVPYPGTIALTYSVVPTWAWSAANLPAGAVPEVVSVAAAAPSGGQAGTIPQVTFPVGTVIYADSSAGSTGPQQLYQAIGAGNLRAYVQGQDDVGHAALSN